MNKTKNNLYWLFVSNIVKGFYQWVLLILIIKFLTTIDAGTFTLAYAVTSPFFMLFNMQLKNIYIARSDHIYDFNYFIIRFLSTIIVIVILVINIHLNDYNYSIFILVILIKSIESVFDIIYASYQKQEEMLFMSKSIILQSLLSLLLFILSIYYFKNLHICLIMIIMSQIIVLLLYDLKKLKKLHNINYKYILFIHNNILSSKNISLIKNILSNSIPLGISVFIGSYLTNLPKIYVEKYLGTDELAFFGALLYMSVGLFQLLLPIQLILRPKLSKAITYQKNHLHKNYLNKAILATFLYGIIMSIVLYIYGDNIVSLIYGIKYKKYANILPYLIISQTIINITVYYNIALQSFHIFKIQIFISTLVFIISLSSGPYLIKNYEIKGAVFLIFLYSILNFIFYFILYIKRTKNVI